MHLESDQIDVPVKAMSKFKPISEKSSTLEYLIIAGCTECDLQLAKCTSVALHCTFIHFKILGPVSLFHTVRLLDTSKLRSSEAGSVNLLWQIPEKGKSQIRNRKH